MFKPSVPRFSIPLICALVASACDDDASAGPANAPDPEICVANDGDGRTQCGGSVCGPGEYCWGSAHCVPGCLDVLNCAADEWCDLRASEPGEAGLCRSIDDPACGGPGGEDTSSESGGVETGGEPVCPSVQGNYTLSLESSSPADCAELLSEGAQCSVSQDACSIGWGCDGIYGSLLDPGPVDASGVYETGGTFAGYTYSCRFEFLETGSFAPDLEWSCSVSQGSAALLCEGFGSR